MRRLLILLPSLLLLVACAEDPEWHQLVSLDFDDQGEERAVSLSLLDYPQFVQFGDEFSSRQGRGVWSYGDRATMRVWAPADSLRIRLRYNTHPLLSRAGQTVQLVVDGKAAGPPRPAPDRWAVDTLTALVALDPPPGRGPHTITFSTSIVANESEATRIADGRPVAVFLKSLELDVAEGPRAFEGWQKRLRANVPGVRPPDPSVVPLTTVEDTGWLVSRREELPDLLVVVLDAARADHFPMYGYPRDTTPHLAELARGGLLFENVFSASSFTLTSTATLFTGYSWATHRLISPGDVLPDEYLTLAELLGLAGYWSLGVSDNPNVGHGSNLSQGFHEFVETWNSGRPFPYALPELFEERLAQGIPRERPAFVYLHALPPHSPYRPGEEHDLWAPEGYEGPVDGSTEQLARIHDHSETPGPADRERWISLYDGNLHLADEIAQRLIDAFLALDRDRPLWIVVTSDHGEAFGEHGLYEHLTDVHDEMTHIPLVVWPASEWSESVPARSRFLSNGDLLPMILGALGFVDLAAAYEQDGIRRVSGTGRLERSFLPLRSHESSHRFGIRTPQVLAIQDGHRRQFFYDVVEDPELVDDLRQDRSREYASWIGRLRDWVWRMRPVNALEPGTHAPDDEDLEALRALGYIR
jgi:arylsulfatase A-like enzyme